MLEDKKAKQQPSALRSGYQKFVCKKSDIDRLDMCYRILATEGKLDQIYVPTCVQFKFKSFTNVDFENLSAMINGVICVNFLIFTHDVDLLSLLLDRLYWNPNEQKTLEINRKKKVERQSYNFLPIFFNKDGNIKIPTTRQKQFQTQAFISPLTIKKSGDEIKGLKITHIIRKQFVVEIIKNTMSEQFLAPFNFINLNLTLTFDYMAVDTFQKPDQDKEKEQKREKSAYELFQKDYFNNISKSIKQYQKDKEEFRIKKIGFNLLRIQDHYNQELMDSRERMQFLSPMISCALADNFGKYYIKSANMQAYTSDRRDANVQIEDAEPTQHTFKPFRYAIFKIPLFRYPIVDTLTIFVPLWLLAFISIYIFYQTTEIMNRIINVAALMIAYAAIQPIVRENIPQATTLTLVDCLFYLELLINILFLARSINIRSLYDDKYQDQAIKLEYTDSNYTYDRWKDSLFLISLALTVLNFVVVIILIARYKYQQSSFRVEVSKTSFKIDNKQNWTLKLLMDRAFARYKESIVFFDDIIARGKKPK